ncbi:MAG: HEAT repeat domain-containing protein [Syntrophotaleaceae bacterium]
MSGDSIRPDKYDTVMAALIHLSKLLQTVRYYPSTHPVLKAASSETLQLFKPLLLESSLTLTVRKDGFLIGQTPIGKDLPVLKNLAFSFFARLVYRILILPDLTAGDLSAFARSIALSPAEIQKAGGLQELLLNAQVTSIWLNEVDLAQIQAIRDRVAEQSIGAIDGQEENVNPGRDEADMMQESAADPNGMPSQDTLEELLSANLDLDRLLDQLEREPSDQRFILLAGKVPAKVREQLHAKGLPSVIRAIQYMKKLGAAPSISVERRREALTILQKLATIDILEFLTACLCARELPTKIRDSIIEALSALKEKATLFLIGRLASEENAQFRRHLSEALIRQGNEALPALVEALSDSRWYVVRNIILVLGKIQDPRVAAHIRPFVDHKEPRVAKEAVRALSRMGGPIAVKSLLHAIETADQEIRIQAFLALGVMKDPSAVRPLIRFVKSFDPFLKRVELKKTAIKALGAIGSREAEPFLQHLLKQRSLWRKARFDNLRCYAALALGQLGGESSIPFLENAAADSSKQVARAAQQALSRLNKDSQ